MECVLEYCHAYDQEKANSNKKAPGSRKGYWIKKGAGRIAHRTDRQACRSCEEAQEGQSLTPRSNQDGG